MNKKKKKLISVDAGCIWIGDPCYIMGDDASHRVRDWITDFCDIVKNDKCSEPLGECTGVCISSGYGDGVYPVEVEYNSENRVASVKITFID
tara:strand:- start:409 stop:684 length:276 start_codon:yes stop_codon:yes gene_type:complete